MSLWLQSLDMALDAVGQGTGPVERERRARVVLAFFAMHVPGKLVAHWLQDPDAVPDYLIDVAKSALRVLHKADELKSFDLAHLLALSQETFTACCWDPGSLADPKAGRPIRDYIEAAGRQLAAHPGLRAMAASAGKKGGRLARDRTPKTIRWCDFDRLAAALSQRFSARRHSVHGPEHWRRVEKIGMRLAKQSGADELVVRLFAWFHDSCRLNDGTDPGHGRRGADLAAQYKGTLYDLEAGAYDQLIYACTWHTDNVHSEDATIGTCWDADRLDLGRVGKIPEQRFMSTEAGRAAVSGRSPRQT
jgi:uncharacterized protein